MFIVMYTDLQVSEKNAQTYEYRENVLIVMNTNLQVSAKCVYSDMWISICTQNYKYQKNVYSNSWISTCTLTCVQTY
jgi:hypothetical protein